MSTWHRAGPAEAAELHEDVLSALGAMDLAPADSALRVRNDVTAGVAAIVDWSRVIAGEACDLKLENPAAEYHRLALVSADSLAQAPGLLRYGDLVGVLRAAAVAELPSPERMVPCGHLVVKKGARESSRIDLYAAAPVDRGGFSMGAPVNLQDSEDLDARADWFRKRHDPD